MVDLVEEAVVDPVVSALIHHVTDLAHVISAQVTNTVMVAFYLFKILDSIEGQPNGFGTILQLEAIKRRKNRWRVLVCSTFQLKIESQTILILGDVFVIYLSALWG